MSRIRPNPGVAHINTHPIDRLSSELSAEQDDPKTSIFLASIVLSQSQPRRYYNPQKIEQLKRSILEHGILEPLLVRPLKDGTYELVAGERRYRAAKEAGFDEVPVVIRELDDKKAYHLALVENLQREDLNPIEETEGILELLSLELEVDKKEVVPIIDQILNSKKRNIELTENVFSQFEKIENVFATTTKLTVDSFRTARLPLLNLPEDILSHLRQGKIEYTKARAIARVKDDKQRKSLLKVAISEDLSLSQIKEKIVKLKTVETKGQESNTDKAATYPQRLKDIYTKAKKVKSWDNPEKQQQIEELLEKLEKLL